MFSAQFYSLSSPVKPRALADRLEEEDVAALDEVLLLLLLSLLLLLLLLSIKHRRVFNESIVVIF